MKPVMAKWCIMKYNHDTLFKIAIKFYGHGSKWRNIKYANNEIQSTSLKIGPI